MLYEFRQTVKNNNNNTSATTTCCIVENPRVENGLNVAEMVGVVAGFSEENNGELVYKTCEPKRFIFGGDFTLTEYTKELINDDSEKTR